MYDLVVKNAKIVDLDGVYEADLAVENGVITRIAKNIDDPAEKKYDAYGRLVFPGAIDGHVHFKLQYSPNVYTADDFFWGTVAAAAGGVTSVIDFVTPESDDYIAEYWKRRAEADKDVIIDYGLHIIIRNCSLPVLNSLKNLTAREGVASIKIFTAYSKRGLMLDDGSIYRLMNFCRDNNILMLVHAENEYLINTLTDGFLAEGMVEPIYHSLSRPDFVEGEAVRRIAYLAGFTGCEVLIVHLSSREGLKGIEEGRRNGVKIHAETCPHYLLLTEDVYRRDDGAKYIMSPPLKREVDRKALWEGLAEGLISVAGSDHACYMLAEKLKHKKFVDVPGGVAGTEVIVMTLFSEGVLKNILSLRRFVELTSYNPALLYGLYPRKGVIMVGADADFYVLDKNRKTRLSKENLHSNIDHSIYDDYEMNCRVVATFSRGELVVEDGQLLTERGRGKYLFRRRGVLNGVET